MSRIGLLFTGLRFRLLLLVLMTCAPLVALTLHTAWEDRRRQVISWQQRAPKIAELSLREEHAVIGDARQLLLAMSESSAVRSGNTQAIKTFLEGLLTSYPKYSNLGLLNKSGDLLVSCFPVSQADDLARKDFFKRTLNHGSFSIGRLSRPRPHRPTVYFGHPVFARSGEVTGVLFAEVDLKWLGEYESDMATHLPRGATWTEIRTNGFILARFPKPEAWVGRLLQDSAVLRAAFAQSTDEGASADKPARPKAGPITEDRARAETSVTPSVLRSRGPTGREAVHAFVPVRSQLAVGPVTGVLSVPSSILFAQANRQLKRNLTWLALAAGLAVALGWIGSNLLIVRPVKALVRTSARLAGGDLHCRTGLRHGRDELGQLTLSFDRMAQALEERELERHHANQKLQVLSHRLVEVQETERRHIARELHDEIGQTLTAAEMNLQAALQSPRAASLERRLEESIKAVERVLEQVHDLSLNLRPSMLDDLGLEPALRWYTHRQASLANLRAEFRPVPLEERPHPVVETECFRIAQEAINNVVKHARAQSVLVELSKANHRLHLTVTDDGVGFDVEAVRDRAVRGESLGVLSMEERATLAGGRLEIDSRRGEGTTVRAWFDLRARLDFAREDLQPVNDNGNQ